MQYYLHLVNIPDEGFRMAGSGASPSPRRIAARSALIGRPKSWLRRRSTASIRDSSINTKDWTRSDPKISDNSGSIMCSTRFKPKAGAGTFGHGATSNTTKSISLCRRIRMTLPPSSVNGRPIILIPRTWRFFAGPIWAVRISSFRRMFKSRSAAIIAGWRWISSGSMFLYRRYRVNLTEYNEIHDFRVLKT